MIKAIIFDMDGVLIDSEPYYQKVLLKCLHHFNIHASTYDLLDLAGGTTQHYDSVIDPLLKDHVSRDTFDEYCHQYYIDFPVDYPQLLFSHIQELLETLNQKGYRLVVASSSKQYEIENVLQQCQLKQYFEFIMSGDMFVESKPNPEIYITCVKKLGLETKECVAIEDSEYGITAAKDAGLICIARKDERFGYNQDRADYLIHESLDILPIIHELDQ